MTSFWFDHGYLGRGSYISLCTVIGIARLTVRSTCSARENRAVIRFYTYD
jgi:hypothetical protein